MIIAILKPLTKLFFAAGMTIWLMSAYVWMLDEIPGTVCVSDGQPLNITEGLPVTSQIRSTDGIAVSAGMMTGGRGSGLSP